MVDDDGDDDDVTDTSEAFQAAGKSECGCIKKLIKEIDDCCDGGGGGDSGDSGTVPGKDEPPASNDDPPASN